MPESSCVHPVEIDGVVRNYAWGSHTALAHLTGRPAPTEQPEAELWFGAHPASPSPVVGGGDLQSLIASDPVAHLGPGHQRLPFLLKFLAADKALSIQVHPTKRQAEQGFARENAAGIALDAFERNYKDDNHKPELLVALTDFEALAGFRPVEKTLQLLELLDCPALEPYFRIQDAGDLRGVLEALLTMPQDTVIDLVEALVRAAEALAGYVDVPQWVARNCRALCRIAGQFPGDRGLLCALLLNHVVLSPGQGLFLAAGQLHAYVCGTGVEIMANSDNVLRGGLTSKHIDVPELLSVLQCDPIEDPTVSPHPDGVYPTPASEFVLTHLRSDKQIHGPAIVVEEGQATWIPAVAQKGCAAGSFVATIP